jgi:hypothetical protein
MSAPTREQALATLEQGDAALQALFGQLSPEEMLRAATIGGGEWSAKDLLGHIAFWEELATEALAEWRAGKRPTVESFIGQEATDAANARNQMVTVRQSLSEVRDRSSSAHRTVVAAILSMSDEEWYARPTYPDPTVATLADLLGGVLAAPEGPFQHAFAHLADLSAYVNHAR